MFVSKGKVQIQLSDLAAYSMVADVSDFILRSVHMSTFFLKQFFQTSITIHSQGSMQV